MGEVGGRYKTQGRGSVVVGSWRIQESVCWPLPGGREQTAARGRAASSRELEGEEIRTRGGENRDPLNLREGNPCIVEDLYLVGNLFLLYLMEDHSFIVWLTKG